jgi:CBS domain-containing protein
MTRLHKLIALASLALAAQPALAEDVRLPAPVLTWSFYIFLLFAAAVAVGIFFVRTRKGLVNEPLGSLVEGPTLPVHAVGRNTPVRECVQQMIELNIGAMLVMEGDELLGIFSERDCLVRVVGQGLDPGETLVRDVMTPDPRCVTPQTSLHEAMSIVTNYRIRHLPVIDGGKVLGMVSSGDLMLRLASGSAADVEEVAAASGGQADH